MVSVTSSSFKMGIVTTSTRFYSLSYQAQIPARLTQISGSSRRWHNLSSSYRSLFHTRPLHTSSISSSASMSSCAHCVTGITHEGTPVGTIQKINGHDTYVSLPKTSYPRDKAVLLLPDIFGIQFINCKLLADDFARSGLPVYAPDYLNGDPAPEPNPKFDIKKWLQTHGPEKTRPVLDDVVKALKAEGIKEFAAVGYCFGGRYVFDLAFDNVIKVAATAHPSFLRVPEDHQKLLRLSKAPLLINAAEVDQQYPIESQLKGDEILGEGKYQPGYKRIFWKGTTHGFAVRGDLKNPKVRKAKEGAFKATVEFFYEHLYQKGSSTSSKL